MPHVLIIAALILTVAAHLAGDWIKLSSTAVMCPAGPFCAPEFIPSALTTILTEGVAADLGTIELWNTVLRIALQTSVVLCILAVLAAATSRSTWQVCSALTLAMVFGAGQIVCTVFATRYLHAPVLVALEQLLGALTLGGMAAAYWSAAPANETLTADTGFKALATAALVSLALTYGFGAWTTANQAGLACPDFPTCRGSWWPPADYLAGFKLWWGEAVDFRGVMLAEDARIATQWVHRIAAAMTFTLAGWLGIAASSRTDTVRLRKAGVILNFLLLATVTLGMLAVRWQLPGALVVGHDFSAALTLIVLLYIHHAAWSAPRLPQPGTTATPIAEEHAAGAIAAPPVVIESPAPQPTSVGLFDRLKSQLSKTRRGFVEFLSLRKDTTRQELIEDLEATLLMADLGVNVTSEFVQRLETHLKEQPVFDPNAVTATLKSYLLELVAPCSQPLVIPESIRPFVILVVGVNGVGKTTTIGKLAKKLQLKGHSVMLAAGDTFRAAAVEQLQTWGERNQIDVVAQQSGADSASVIYDAVQAAQARGIDILIADTAGRLHTKSNLMDELSKIKRIIGKLDAQAPHEVLLVLDAGTGQNAISQARLFNEAVGLTGIALTKLDGTAKGGVIFALAKQFGLPIRFIGIGESIDDLQVFHAEQFVDALFAKETSS